VKINIIAICHTIGLLVGKKQSPVLNWRFIMQVHVKAPLIKIEGDIPPDLLTFVKTQYKHVTVEYDEDDEYEEVTETEWFKNIQKDMTPQKTLKLLRNRDNLTQAQLAEKLCINVQNVSGMERGIRPISVAMAKKLGIVFNTNYKKFL